MLNKYLKILIIFFISTSISKAELIKPNSSIRPAEVVKIQLLGLQKNNEKFKDSGIEQPGILLTLIINELQDP